jgi:hypothetical protein
VDPSVHPVLTPAERDFYGELYRCEACSCLIDPEGVYPFASPNAPQGQTLPVSHFGDVKKALIWLVVTNPKGNRNDPNVGLAVKQFAANRGALANEDIDPIFEHFSKYDFTSASPEFFGPWRELLNDLIVGGKNVTFESGGICAVDLIKCPTRTGWLSYVKTDEGKKVWENCHGLKLKGHDFVKGSEFLFRQIELHNPPVVILPGTKLNGEGYTERAFGRPNTRLKALIGDSNAYVMNVRSLDDPKRLSIELGGARQMKTVLANKALFAQTRSTIESIIRAWNDMDDA